MSHSYGEVYYINCGNNKVEVCALLCVFYKIPLNKPNSWGMWIIL